MIPEIDWGDGPAVKHDIKAKLLIIANDTELPQSIRDAARAELRKLQPEH